MAACDNFNDPFWVAIAAAAPVIGLASAVTMQQIWDRATKRAEKEGVSPGRYTGTTYLVGFTNVFLQTIVLSIALSSLSHCEDIFPRDWLVKAEGAGMFLIFVPLVVSFFVRSDEATQRQLREFEQAAKAFDPDNPDGPGNPDG